MFAISKSLIIILLFASVASAQIRVGAVPAVTDATNPTATITSPTSATTYDAMTASTLNFSGTASDNVAVISVTFSTDNGQTNVACTGTTTWSCSSANLADPTTIITVSAHDLAGNIGTDAFTITTDLSGGGDPGLLYEQDFEDDTECPAITIDSSGDDPCIGDTVLDYYSHYVSNGEYTKIVKANANCHGTGTASTSGDCIRFFLRDGNPGSGGVLNINLYGSGITDITTQYFSAWVRYKQNGIGGPGWRVPGPVPTSSKSTPNWHKKFYFNSGAAGGSGSPIIVMGCGTLCGTQNVSSATPNWVYGNAGGVGTSTVSWTTLDDDDWHHFETYMENGASGLVKTCVDGTLVENVSVNWASGVLKFILLGENLSSMDADNDPTTDSTTNGEGVEYFQDDIYISRNIPTTLPGTGGSVCAGM